MPQIASVSSRHEGRQLTRILSERSRLLSDQIHPDGLDLGLENIVSAANSLSLLNKQFNLTFRGGRDAFGAGSRTSSSKKGKPSHGRGNDDCTPVLPPSCKPASIIQGHVTVSGLSVIGAGEKPSNWSDHQVTTAKRKAVLCAEKHTLSS